MPWRDGRPIGICRVILAFFALTCIGFAQNYTAPGNPQVGSQNTVTANAPVPRPNTTPCVVQLFSNLDFDDFNPKFFTYTPPADCPGPWSAVVLNADWSIDAGRQFDRTAEIWIGAANVYFGTTAEPSHTVARSWHIESNLTDYSPLFTTMQSGRVDLGNLVNNTYTSVIHGSAYIQYYPLAQGQKAPRTADVVLPMSASSNGGTVTLNTTSDQLVGTWRTPILPTNIEGAYLDVFSQSQSGDEFWYTCAPNDVATELQNCGGTGFREAQVSIDGTPAGVAPVYPWIYTGGIDPYLWRPIPGVHTLNFEPYRVDLTPFAGVLSNGQQQHTVAVNVFNANGYFSETATLLLYRDSGSSQVTGAVTQNTIGQPNPTVREKLKVTNTDVSGKVTVQSNRGFTVEGWAQTSHGTVDTQINESIDFRNTQDYYVKNDGSVLDQSVDQRTNVSERVITKDSNHNVAVRVKQLTWPLKLTYDLTLNPDGSFTQNTTLGQKLNRLLLNTWNGWPVYYSAYSDAVSPTDNLAVSAQGVVTTTNQANREDYSYNDSTGACWNETVKAEAGALTKVSGGSCQGKH